MADNRSSKNSPESLSRAEERDVEKRVRLRVPVVYEIVRQEGEDELARPLSSLWWSGLAAGLGISMSVVAEGLLRQNLPDASWRPLIANLGYCTGFLIVVLGRLQLFTENTITAVLPLLAERSWRNGRLTARLWIIVLAANLVGTFFFSFAVLYFAIFPVEQIEAFLMVSRHFMEKNASEMLLHGIPAGFLVAAMVWMIPSAKGAEFWVITLMTYLIALGDLSHVIAGSTEAFLLLMSGEIGIWTTVGEFLVPTFVGNVIGGTVLFALLAYGQIKEEL